MEDKKGTVYVTSDGMTNMTTDEEKEFKQQVPEVALDQLAVASEDMLFETKTVFPFDLFPDTLRITKNQVEIVYWNDFFSKYIYPMPIHKVLTARVHKGLFFAELEIEIEGHEQDPTHVKYLWKDKAEEAAQIILGLKVSHVENINIKNVPAGELVNKVKQISVTHLAS